MENVKGLCECGRSLALRRQPGITGEDQPLHSHCEGIGKEGTGCEEHWVGGPVGCGGLVEEASVRVSDDKKHLRGEKLNSPFA